MARRFGLLAAVTLATLLAPAGASADPDELMPCRLVFIKARPTVEFGFGLTKFACRPLSGGSFPLPSAGAAGTVHLSVNVVPPGNGLDIFPIPCTGLGIPAGSKGYRCAVNASGGAVFLKPNVVKGRVKFDFGIIHPFTGDVAIRLRSAGATDEKRYCARFPLGSAIQNTPTAFKAKDAPAPTACSPSGAFVDEGDGPF